MFSNSVVIALRLQLALLWWRVCALLLRLLHTQSLKPANQYFHKVVVIGDDFAAGVGDFVTLGKPAGLAQHLAPLIAHNDKVRHRWEIVNAGVPGSTSADWLLNAPTQYYNSVFAARSTVADAEIVIVMLGSTEIRDPKADVVRIRKHLIAICDALCKKGKRVCLATVASPAPLKTGDSDTSPLNVALEEFCKSTSTDELPVVLGPRLDTYAFRRDTSLAFDGYHFNSSAYRLLARNAADFLVPMMTAVEWATWKKQLNQVTYDKALYD
ncbi:hypothetical protein PybrP1_001138 [[Pythium] brassicae (nom. inval.)]|nr:hypothetical protein PybrP1_001138 [[Pythium] brassicae (nom. inval.)]